MTDFDPHKVAADNKALTGYIAETVRGYKSLAVQLHTSAAMALFHALQFREASAMNALYHGLRVNDQTALRLWVGRLTLTPGNTERNATDKAASLIGYTKDKGFFVRKGLKSEDAWALDDLLAAEPFFNKNVQDRDALTLDKLLTLLGRAASNAETKADENDIVLPDEVKKLIGDITSVTTKAKARIANDNGGNSNLEAAAR